MNGARASAGAIASGLAAASTGVLVTVLIATGGHGAAERPVAAKGTSVARSSAATPPPPMPRHVVPTVAVARPRPTPARHVSALPARPAISAPVHTAPQPPPSPSSVISGISYWQQLMQRFGMTAWPTMGQPGRYQWP